ncbi:uncharacterized protein LOC110454592 [Mizuhopecten yessoensis]|uniref:Uncharacterized protein n=1 Tax=Mizuhopecten yessoensis TaxID=6573 RepID=A0A210QEU5_MIZYE|nr:uncharacterized protein LOC110454592 [Mizuhopecten yessoensis]OWF47248.1 hypothetical protein KP79_PYT05862 [Mizuhopecten yessoensis]
MSAVMVLRVLIVTVLFCGCLTSPMKPEAANRGLFSAFQDIFGCGVNMMLDAAGGMSQTIGAGMDTAMNMFGGFSPFQWNPFASNAALDNVLSSATIKPPTETTIAPTVAPTTSANPEHHWIALGRK